LITASIYLFSTVFVRITIPHNALYKNNVLN